VNKKGAIMDPDDDVEIMEISGDSDNGDFTVEGR